ncbi:MAG: FAD-dependent thymidylate synthase [bacterium]
MKINLAGYNVDKKIIDELSKNSGSQSDATPETISASYARISRDPRPIDELRNAARSEVEKARRSNKSIIFQMGHHSIAEHAVFNFDLIGVSRYVIEFVEKFRLCSFTEKSQRYITLGSDFVIPKELENSSLQDEYVALINEQNALYSIFYERLKPYVFAKYSKLAEDLKKHNMIEGWAKEDARYITPLATKGQLGLTINARNLELLFRRFASNSLEEAKDLGRKMYELVEKVAPSLILFVDANDFDKNTYAELAEFNKEMEGNQSRVNNDEVKLVDYTKDGDDIVLASLLHTVSKKSYQEVLSKIKSFSEQEKKDLIKRTFKYMQFYDSTLREFEYVNLTFELEISASCFAQLKRHRMATITCQDYDPLIGMTIPDSIKEIGEEEVFVNLVEKSSKLYNKLLNEAPSAAPYILTNAHRRRVLIRVNARELYHISRLREDEHAQWDIRQISTIMSKKASEVMPLTFMLICGKSSFNGVFGKLFEKE